MRWRAALILLLAGVPVAAGADVGGNISASALLLPAESVVEAVPRAFFVERVGPPDQITGTSPSLVVRVFEETYVQAITPAGRPTVVLESRRPVWTADDVTILIEAGSGGWIGIHPADATIRAEGEETELARVMRPIGNGTVPDQPDQPFYHADVSEPLVEIEAARWRFEGDGTMKLRGPTVTLGTRENTTTIVTGDIRDPYEPARRTRRWVALELQGSTLEGATERGALVGAPEVFATWEGRARVLDARGELEGSVRSWDVAGDAILEGELSARATPRATGGLHLLVEGDLHATGAEARLTPEPSAAPLWLVPAALAAVATGVIGALLARRRRNAPPAIGAEEALRLAEDAADRGDLQEAARWAALAREQSPTSVRVGLDHAFHLWRAGRARDALAHLGERPLAGEPAADLLRARILDAEGSEAEAATMLAAALARTPTLVLDVDEDEALGRIARRSPAREALAAARRRLG